MTLEEIIAKCLKNKHLTSSSLRLKMPWTNLNKQDPLIHTASCLWRNLMLLYRLNGLSHIFPQPSFFLRLETDPEPAVEKVTTFWTDLFPGCYPVCTLSSCAHAGLCPLANCVAGIQRWLLYVPRCLKLRPHW